MARFQRDYNGKQPGDPARAAAVLLHIAGLAEPPLRLLLGSDAADAAEKKDLARIEADRRWRDLSVSTDFRTDGSPGWSDRHRAPKKHMSTAKEQHHE